MTIDAQAALRRIIEAHAQNTRFCIICNYIAKIIDPLASRCVKFRFAHIEQESQMKRLQSICKEESIKLESDAVLNTLIDVSDGDLRRSINLLQTCSSFIKVEAKEAEDKMADDGDVVEDTGMLTRATIEQISGIVPKSVILNLQERLWAPGSGYSHIQEIAEDMILEGYDTQQLLHSLLESFINIKDPKKLNDFQKSKIAEIIA